MEPLNEEFLPKTEHGDFFPNCLGITQKPAPFLRQNGGKVVDNKNGVHPL
jgi:hypothetical protein